MHPGSFDHVASDLEVPAVFSLSRVRREVLTENLIHTRFEWQVVFTFSSATIVNIDYVFVLYYYVSCLPHGGTLPLRSAGGGLPALPLVRLSGLALYFVFVTGIVSCLNNITC